MPHAGINHPPLQHNECNPPHKRQASLKNYKTTLRLAAVILFSVGSVIVAVVSWPLSGPQAIESLQFFSFFERRAGRKREWPE
jgi:hypothetical protein